MHIDHEQFIKLYNNYAPRILKYCYFRVNSKEEAEDITTQVFIKTWDYLQKGNEIEYPKTFLYKTASNLVIDYYRTSKHKRTLLIDDPNITIDIPDEYDVSKELDIKKLVNSIQNQIQELPETYREIVILRFINDLTIPEISQITNVSANNVSVRLHRAVNALKEKKYE